MGERARPPRSQHQEHDCLEDGGRAAWCGLQCETSWLSLIEEKSPSLSSASLDLSLCEAPTGSSGRRGFERRGGMVLLSH